MPNSAYTIHPARSAADLSAARTLISAYAASLGVDLTFQSFASEMADLPGAYAPPHGELLLLRHQSTGEAIGCVALRPLKSSKTTKTSKRALSDDSKVRACEGKRFYILPAYRGTGAGMALAKAAQDVACRLGYSEILLDSLESMDRARKVYGAMGFEECEAYYETPLAGTTFWKLRLSRL